MKNIVIFLLPWFTSRSTSVKHGRAHCANIGLVCSSLVFNHNRGCHRAMLENFTLASSNTFPVMSTIKFDVWKEIDVRLSKDAKLVLVVRSGQKSCLFASSVFDQLRAGQVCLKIYP